MGSIGLAELMKGDREKLLALLLGGTSVGRGMIEEIEGERADERRRLVADLNKLTVDGSATSSRLQDALAAAFAEQDAARAAVQAAAERAAQALWKWEKHDRDFGSARRRLVGQLEATADPQVREFLRWLESEIVSCRRGRFDPANPSTGANQIRRKLDARRRALATAINEASQLLLSPASPVEIGEEIARIRDSLPPDPGGEIGSVVGFATVSR